MSIADACEHPRQRNLIVRLHQALEPRGEFAWLSAIEAIPDSVQDGVDPGTQPQNLLGIFRRKLEASR